MKFKILQYRTDAEESTVAVFNGQKNYEFSTSLRDMGEKCREVRVGCDDFTVNMSYIMKTEPCNMCMIRDAESRVPVQERLHKPPNPWSGLTFSGGYVEPDGKVFVFIIREVQEKTGLTVSSLQNRNIFSGTIR